MPRRPFIRKQKKKRHGANFWDHEYTAPEHLALSTSPSEDFLKFLRYCERHQPQLLGADNTALDLGCGNGRQLAHLHNAYGLSVVGYDISRAAIAQAAELCASDRAEFHVRSIAEPLPLADDSCALVLDMMTSHFLKAGERARLRDEVYRVLQPGGMLLMKTFLRDQDLHSARLLQDYPGPEPFSYIHPVIGVAEYVYSEEELRDFLGSHFSTERLYRSHKHRLRGKARKRRTITIYAQKSL